MFNQLYQSIHIYFCIGEALLSYGLLFQTQIGRALIRFKSVDQLVQADDAAKGNRGQCDRAGIGQCGKG